MCLSVHARGASSLKASCNHQLAFYCHHPSSPHDLFILIFPRQRTISLYDNGQLDDSAILSNAEPVPIWSLVMVKPRCFSSEPKYLPSGSLMGVMMKFEGCCVSSCVAGSGCCSLASSSTWRSDCYGVASISTSPSVASSCGIPISKSPLNSLGSIAGSTGVASG